jgi:copper chaperone CopZ
MKARSAGFLAAVLGSICCVGPLLLIAVGIGTGAAVIGRYHWLFLIAGIAVLTWAWSKYLREKTVCDCEYKTMQGRRSGMLTLLIATVIVLGFGSLNISRYLFASAPASAQTQTQVANGLNHIVIPVNGMSCVTCEIAVRHALKRVDGVKSAHVSVATNSATVDYDPAKTNTEQLVAAVNSTGYRTSLPDKMNDSVSMAKNKNTNDTKKGVASASGGENAAITTAERISLFNVSLQCPAAPQIGCGSASKPILLDLESQPGVLEAWLNRAGTTIAVVWKPESDAEMRRNVSAELKEDHATEIKADSRDEVLKGFLSGRGWYRGADVNRLSQEEAGIIAARLVRRVQAKTALAEDKAEGLQHALADSLRKDLTGESADQSQKQTRLEEVAREYLDRDQIKVLSQAIEKGVRPLRNEN